MEGVFRTARQVTRRREERAKCHEHGCRTHERVQHRNELRHCRHLHGFGAPNADDGANDDGGGHEANDGTKGLRGRDERHEYDGNECEHHARDAEEVAALSGLLFGKPRKCEDEEERRDQVREGLEMRESVENRGVHH